MNGQTHIAASRQEDAPAQGAGDRPGHAVDVTGSETRAKAHERQALEQLRAGYRDRGLEVPEAILHIGLQALEDDRFAHIPPPFGWRTTLARLYVARGRWGRPVLALAGLIVVGLMAYAFVYQPIQRSQIEAARVELTETLPQRMQDLYDGIYVETKVQAALEQADPWLTRGLDAAARGERAGALTAINELERIHDTLLAEYTLRIVNREGQSTGIWTFPEDNSEATNYYLVVEAIGPEGNALALPIGNAQTGSSETVSIWAVRVPEATYERVRVDRLDDGVIQRDVLGIKQYGFLDVEYVMPVLDGTLTQW